MVSFTTSFYVLLTYLIESWIFPGWSYEFNAVYVQQEKKPQYLLYYNYISTIHIFKNENERKSLKRGTDLTFNAIRVLTKNVVTVCLHKV